HDTARDAQPADHEDHRKEIHDPASYLVSVGGADKSECLRPDAVQLGQVQVPPTRVDVTYSRSWLETHRQPHRAAVHIHVGIGEDIRVPEFTPPSKSPPPNHHVFGNHEPIGSWRDARVLGQLPHQILHELTQIVGLIEIHRSTNDSGLQRVSRTS